MNIKKSDKNNIQRGDLKHSFIKQIILTFEFNGLNKKEVLEAEEEVRNQLYDLGYTKYENLRYDEYEEENDELKLGVGEKALCRYLMPNSRTEILFSEDFVTIVDSIDRYKKIEGYFDALILIIDALRGASRFFIPKKLGIRKKNVCYLKKIEDLKEYFNVKIFPEYEYKTLFGIDKFVCESKRDLWGKEDLQIDYERWVVAGEIVHEKENKDVFQVILDFDIYINDEEKIKEYIRSKEECKKFLVRMNNVLYDLYVKSLNNDFLIDMTKDKFKENKIIGVTKNV